MATKSVIERDMTLKYSDDLTEVQLGDRAAVTVWFRFHSARAIAVGALALVSASTVAPAQVPGLLLAAHGRTRDSIEMEAIAVFRQGRFDSLPAGNEEAPSVAFRRAAFKAGGGYWLYSGGVRRGRLTVTGLGDYPCTGLTGIGRAPSGLSTEWQGLAHSDSTLRAAGARRASTVAEAAALRVAVRPLLIRLGSPPSASDTAQLLDGWTVEDMPANSRWVTGGFRASSTNDSGLVIVHSVFAVLEIERGVSRLALRWTNTGLEDDAQTRVPVDIIDLDGDGIPELVTKTTYSESWDYQIWRRRPTGWTLWVSGGGVGC
jgi:hypothetical protein